MTIQFKAFLSLLLLVCLCTGVRAQKLGGNWELVQRKANKPCAADVLITFGAKGGGGTITYGSREDGCTEITESFASWEVAKEEVRKRSGGTTKVKMINLKEADGEVLVQWALLEYVDDFMLVQAEVADGDSTRPGKLIFKRLGGK